MSHTSLTSPASRSDDRRGDGAPAGLRRRLIGVLFGGVAVSRTGYIAAITMTTLAAEDMLGSPAFAGLPGAASVLGSAWGGAWLASLMDRVGRRRGLRVGYMLLTTGALGAALAVAAGWFALLVPSMVVFGTGASADNLARYAAADVAPSHSRGSAIAFVVWAGAVGSVVGPFLLAPAKTLGAALGIVPSAGVYLLAAFTAMLAMVIVSTWLRPDPLEFADRGDRNATDDVPPLSSAERLALVALVVGHVVMVLIMVMTPIHLRAGGHGLGVVGMVISAHTLGMFAFSPLTGAAVDRFGRPPVILIGHVTLAGAAVLAAAADVSATWLLAIALFLLGLGWNLSFVGGSALLTDGADPVVRVRRQGIGDAAVWTSAAVAGVASGLLLSVGSYALLSLTAASLTLVPVTLIVSRRAATVSP